MRSAALVLLTAATALPAAATPAFKHIVLIVQENRTPDNLFGSNPTFEQGVDIATSGVDSHGRRIQLVPRPLSDCYDVEHAHKDFVAMLTQGADKEKVKPKGGCRLPSSPEFTYVDNAQGAVAPYFALAAQYGFANRMFQTNQGPSFPAHQFLFGGTSAPKVNSSLFASENTAHAKTGAGCTAPAQQRVKVIDSSGSETANAPIYPCFEHPTLGDILDGASPPVSWDYYAADPGQIWTAPNAINHICQPARQGRSLVCAGQIWTRHVHASDPGAILTDIGNCKLAGVSWVTPTAADSDHPVINKGTGPQWVASIVNAIGTQTCAGESYWNDTAIFITWDDWGGWYDHVAPFQQTRPPAWGAGYTYGFRVPLLVVSAYTQAGSVSNNTLDFGTLLYFTEHNFGLGFIGAGDTVLDEYADYWAAARPGLDEFFTLSSPRPFVKIPVRMAAKAFVHEADISPPDDD